MTMEAARAILRYNAIWAASHALRGEVQTFVRDRANDAHARADALRSGTSLRRAA